MTNVSQCCSAVSFLSVPLHWLSSLLAPPTLSFLTIYQHTALFPEGSALIPASISQFSLFITALTLRNIVLDCLADAIILGLYLHNHISHLHSWVLTGARQVKHHTLGDKTMEAHLEFGPGLSPAPRHYQKHSWPFFHLANASMPPSPSSLYAHSSASLFIPVSFLTFTTSALFPALSFLAPPPILSCPSPRAFSVFIPSFSQ